MSINSLDIRKYREQNGLSQTDLAELVGVSFRTIQNYEAGHTIPKSKYAIFHKLITSGAVKSKNVDHVSTNKDKIEANKDLLNRVQSTILELKSNNSLKALKELEGLIELKYKIIEVLKQLEG